MLVTTAFMSLTDVLILAMAVSFEPTLFDRAVTSFLFVVTCASSLPIVVSLAVTFADSEETAAVLVETCALSFAMADSLVPTLPPRLAKSVALLVIADAIPAILVSFVETRQDRLESESFTALTSFVEANPFICATLLESTTDLPSTHTFVTGTSVLIPSPST